MTFINYNTREINCKIVYYGPALSGKTRNLKHIYENTALDHKGELISLMGDDERTCYFDFLPLFLGKIRGFRTRLHLYSVPGSVIYDSNRRLILKGVDAIVFVADSRHDKLQENLESLQNLKKNLSFYKYQFENIPHVFQWNFQDAEDVIPAEELSRLLNAEGAPEFHATAKKGEGVFETLKAISKMVVSELVKGK